ncbi:glycerol-3-phosphate acyltransferase 3 [Senna tora]|uniref:Glycerol-3-phosphate acyltransferase 3 n=1 Tax=Senna tora TaxID=362788 RepID=A0A834WF13_9FABA|nr:glycerol-3-phosphate acyltransferase 3 [Senna tora]
MRMKIALDIARKKALKWFYAGKRRDILFWWTFLCGSGCANWAMNDYYLHCGDSKYNKEDCISQTSIYNSSEFFADAGFPVYLKEILQIISLYVLSSEAKDREIVAKKLSADINPLLIFLEGTCVNNQYTVMFKKGAFELGCTFCPVAIKYNKIFVDAFWNSRKQSFTMHLHQLMTSWVVVCDVCAVRYKSSKSSTYTKNGNATRSKIATIHVHHSGTSCEITYGSGSISGFFSQDNVNVGDIVVKNQDFIETTREGSLSFVLAKFDGILGLGFQEISVGKAVPVWYNMLIQIISRENIIMFQLLKKVTGR